MSFNIGGKKVTSESLDRDAKAHLVPDGTKLLCVIADAVYVPEATFDERVTPGHVKIEFICSDKESDYYRKAAFKKYPIEGEKRKSGIDGLTALDVILGGVIKNGCQAGGDLTDSKFLGDTLSKAAVTAEFRIWDMAGRVGNFIGDVSKARGTVFNPSVDVAPGADIGDDDIPF